MSLVTTYWGVPQPVAGIFRAPAGRRRRRACDGREGPAFASRHARSCRDSPAGERDRRGQAQAVPAQQEGIVDSIRNWPGWATVRARMVRGVGPQSRRLRASSARTRSPGARRERSLPPRPPRPASARSGSARSAVITYAVLAVGAWLAGAYLTYWVGTTLFTGRRSDESKEWLFKSLAFAQGPRLLLLAGFLLPGFSVLLALAMFMWTLAASVPAVEESSGARQGIGPPDGDDGLDGDVRAGGGCAAAARGVGYAKATAVGRAPRCGIRVPALTRGVPASHNIFNHFLSSAGRTRRTGRSVRSRTRLATLPARRRARPERP